MPEPDSLENFVRLHPRIRLRFPLLERDAAGNPRVHLNCGAGTLMVDSALEAMGEAGRRLNSLPGDVVPAEIATRDFHARVRRTAAAFLNARDPAEVSFHVSSTGALFNLAFSLRGRLDPRNNLVVTDLDHLANVSPWETVWGEMAGCEVRRCPIDDQGRIGPGRLVDLCDERTGLVALTLASNALGTIVPVKEMTAALRRRSPRALVCVDAVHHALHGLIDVQDLDCDFLVFSGYKIFGPMIGVLWGRGEVLDGLRPYRVETNKNEAPFKFEQGSLNNSALAGLQAALEYLAWVGRGARDADAPQEIPGRDSFVSALAGVEAYDRTLSAEVLKGFERLSPGRFGCFGIVDPARCSERDPTFAFEIRGLSPADLKKRLWREGGLQVADGNHYSAAVVRHLGRPAVCRASFCHYHSLAEARKFVDALADMVS
jgi:selenocysteine lyase/cysteine desulfurase